MKNGLFSLFVLALAVSCSGVPEDGIHTLCILSTNDVHGAYFDSTYTGGSVRPSLMAVKSAVDSIRALYGKDNVLLFDVGDNLQGDNAAYYYNFVDTAANSHIYPKMVRYIGYDAVILGNHDIETGHGVYDRVAKQMKRYGIPYLAGNAIKPDGTRYFEYYSIFEKSGLKILLLGYDNANISAWLDEKLWSGMRFESLIPLVQNDVDEIVSKEHPDIVIVAAHTGTGKGDGSVLENQGLDLLNSLKGVNVVLDAHDHKPFCDSTSTAVLVNSGSKCRFLGQALLNVEVNGGKVVDVKLSAHNIKLDGNKSDAAMSRTFRKEFLKVRSFTVQEVGSLSMDMRTRDSFLGMCDYMNLIHTVCMKYSGADISFAAPLTYDGTINAGTLIFDDMFTIYPFENQLYVMNMTGREIKGYLETSYDGWVNTVCPDKSDETRHALKIEYGNIPGSNRKGWMFNGRSYNFDSAAGIIYSVDITKLKGDRVQIVSMADGKPFDEDATYRVALTSYRASGGGGLVISGAGIQNPESRIINRYRDIRGLIYQYILDNHEITPEMVGDKALIGSWEFIPYGTAGVMLVSDFKLLFN